MIIEQQAGCVLGSGNGYKSICAFNLQHVMSMFQSQNVVFKFLLLLVSVEISVIFIALSTVIDGGLYGQLPSVLGCSLSDRSSTSNFTSAQKIRMAGELL